MRIPEDARTIFTFNAVPVKARPVFWGLPVLLWAAMTLLARKRRPKRPWSQSLWVGALSAFVGLSADIGHAMAHTVSARYAGAPMEVILLGADMPRTLYNEERVSPRTHILRALGGPMFNGIGFILSLIWKRLSPIRSISRELADISTVTHGLLFFGSLAPLPMVDGGTIYKWTKTELEDRRKKDLQESPVS